MTTRLRDDDGAWVAAGDRIRFSYGIPPACVIADIVSRGGELVGLAPDHNPPEFLLRSLRNYVGVWYKAN